jgi:subtilisin family serine protease
MSAHDLKTPWAPRHAAYTLPNAVVLKLALGEAPASIPAAADVRSGLQRAAQTIDGGPIDRIVRHFAGGMRVARVHAAAATLLQPSARHRAFNDREQALGLARTFRVEVPVGTPIGPLIDSLNQLPHVENAAPNYLSTAPFAAAATGRFARASAVAPAATDDWAPWDRVRAVDALGYEPGDPAVIVALVDTGVTRQHPDLPQMRGGWDTVQLGDSDLAAGVHLLGHARHIDTNPEDHFVGHGSACAGIIGALGFGMPPGLAGAAQLLPMRALGAALFPGKTQPVGIGATTDLDMAMKMAVDLGAKVINMSFGTDDAVLAPDMPKPHADVVRYAIDRGCVLVAASGNSYCEATYWPAAYPGVIAVGSVDVDGAVSAFTTRGTHVALCAPGERVRSTGLTGYQNVTGTSFAAPFVTAAAALLVARAARRSAALDSPTARHLLTRSAISFGSPAIRGCGTGVLDALAALRAVDAWLDDTLPAEDIDDG